MYSYVIRMSLLCTPMSSVCHSYVLACHPYVTRINSYVIRMSLVCGFTMNRFLWCLQISRKVGVNNNIYSFLISWHMYQTGWILILFLLSYFLLKIVSIINESYFLLKMVSIIYEPHCYKKIAMFHKNSQMTMICYT